MTFITLFSNEHGFVGTDQLVFAPEELEALSSVMEKAQSLQNKLCEQVEKEAVNFNAERERGYAEGLLQGRATGEAQVASELHQMHEQHVETLDQLRASCAELAVDIVRKIAGSISSEQWLVAQARQAAEDIVEQPSVKLRVHSSKVEVVRRLLAENPQPLIHGVVADDSLAYDACVLDTGNGQIDVSLETQLESILDLFNDSQNLLVESRV